MTEPLTRPEPQHFATTATLQVVQLNSPPEKAGDPEKAGIPEGGESGTDHDGKKLAPGDPEGGGSGTDHDGKKRSSPSIYDFFLLFCIVVMLIWPWIFFGVVWAKKGIQMDNHVAKVVTNNPHATTYIITYICTIISMIVTTLFSLAIIRFAQEFVTRHRPARPFHATVLLALRHQSWPSDWGKKSWKDVKYLLTENRWWPVALVIICTLTFPHLVSTITSLITPIQFDRIANLNGTELDFTASDPACVNYYESNPINSNCDWAPFEGQYYSTCLGENQMVDVLEAGRGNILELLSNNSQTLTFSQLGADNGLHFLGSIQGVLPIGPGGVPTLDNSLEPYPFSDPEISAAIVSYDYTFNHQGLASTVSCSYQPTTPIVSELTAGLVLSYNVSSCAALGGTDILANTLLIVPSAPAVTSTLMFWACQSPANDTQVPSYSVYLSGSAHGYQNNTGNITCAVSIEPAIYPVGYNSTTRIFSVGTALPANDSGAYSSSVFSSILVGYPFTALGGVISEGQNFDSNLVAESVITFGVKSFGLAPYVRNDTYLRLYEQMIQGILEYETSYTRLLYSLGAGPSSPSCLRTVTGSVDYVVLGWFVTKQNIGFLFPMTLVNAAALVAVLLALAHAKVVGYHHPRDLRDVEYDPKFKGEEVPDEWKEKIAFQPISMLKGNLTDMKNLVESDGKNMAEGYAEGAVKSEASQFF